MQKQQEQGYYTNLQQKCGKEVEGLGALNELSNEVNVVTLPNVGRCDHSYAYWINEHYEFVEKEKEMNGNNDIVMFLKDNNQSLKGEDLFAPIDLLFSHVSKSGFGCVIEPFCSCFCTRRNLWSNLLPAMQYFRKEAYKYTLWRYSRLERDDSSVFQSRQYPDLKSWKEDMGFVIPESETMPICYGGLFAAQKKQILNQSSESWKKMEASLSRSDNIVEGHYAERMWAPILSDVDDESARAVDEVLKPNVDVLSYNTRC